MYQPAYSSPRSPVLSNTSRQIKEECYFSFIHTARVFFESNVNRCLLKTAHRQQVYRSFAARNQRDKKKKKKKQRAANSKTYLSTLSLDSSFSTAVLKLLTTVRCGLFFLPLFSERQNFPSFFSWLKHIVVSTCLPNYMREEFENRAPTYHELDTVL